MVTLFGKRIRLFRPHTIWIRRIVQWVFFLLIASIAVSHTLAESGMEIPILSGASIHAVCPFGGVETLYTFATSGLFVRKIHDSSLVLAGIVLLLSILFGPVFCGWVCPLGTVQEWVGKLGRKIFKRRYNHFVPVKVDRILRFARYGILIWVLYVTAKSGTLVFEAYDPYFALFNFWSTEVVWSAIAILIATLTLSVFVERPWCKYACPYGAVLGITNLFRVFSIKRSELTCKADGACSIMCPMNIQVDTQTVIRDHQCISCLECTSEAICPVAKTVVFTSGGVK
ncbi:MAG TPA: 4Fe-4S binding protein [Anaerolineales bacterium]|nr:4Fe-4S binding protein [Anaerolineales bacterium]HNB37258.1 4Fe-4S binding protein [Anaerolineales bacterium]